MIEQAEVREQDGALSRYFVKSVEMALKNKNHKRLRKLFKDIHESDAADLLTLLRPEQRALLMTALGRHFDFNVLPELDETVRNQIIEEMPNEQVAEAVRELETDDAVYLLEDMTASDQSEILAQIPAAERAALQRSLDYPEDSAGRIMQADIIVVAPKWTVGQTIDYMRETSDLPENFSEIYVVDPFFHLLGTVPLSRLLRTQRPVEIENIMEKDLFLINVLEDQEEVARQFERYNMISSPVIDEDKRLAGAITVDDIMEVIQEEAEEDIHRLGGVGAESLADTVWKTTRLRFSWLFVNLITAVIASMVIGLFDATIQEMVALAVLMPIVASMGGNAGTQTMTVTVRALATRELSAINSWRIVLREMLVGILNGAVFAVLMGLIAYLWFNNSALGVVIAIAMIFNLIVAALSGILIPLALDKFKIDPAVASSVFVTTVTDVVGFFAFLGLAAWWFGI
ncbi:MAG: magnesium transporter [Methyloligellaceae bacterium]